MKKRLLIVLGAGSSIECGMPSVSEINDLMREWSAQFAARHHRADYFAMAWDALEAHLNHGFASNRDPPDFEKALSDLVALMQWVRPPPEGGALRRLVGGEALAPSLVFSDPVAFGPYIEIKTSAAHLVQKLASEMRVRSCALSSDMPAMEAWHTFLDELRSQFDIAIYNLNYDAVALTCWPDAFTGFDVEGRFDPRAVHEREWNGLLHLHGSVHFSLADQAGERIVWRNDLGGDFNDCDDRSAVYGSNGNDFMRSTLIAGGFKLDQLLGEPFHAYRAALVRDAARADAILLAGYGFTDMHVNRALYSALAYARSRAPVLVLDWAKPKTDPLAFREDRWAHGLYRWLNAPGPYRPPGTHVFEAPATLAEQGACEVSGHHRVAVWYGGFTAAASHVTRFAQWMDGGADTLLSAHG